MASKACTTCGRVPPGKLLYAYFHYFDDQERMSRRATLCPDCVFEHFAPLTEHADRMDRFGNWNIEREVDQWQQDALSEITRTVQRVAPQLAQSTATTSTSTEDPARELRSSATPAGSSQSQQARTYSAHLMKSEPISNHSKTSATSSPSTSASESTSHSSDLPPAPPTSTGSRDLSGSIKGDKSHGAGPQEPVDKGRVKSRKSR